jgi:2,4-dienoyl-CoA reductase-like NADH-dependent reductase (Old Yellow Enzyme family)
MSMLFTPQKLGRLEIKNRFVRAPTHESMSSVAGEVTDDLVAVYRTLAKGGVGLIVTGIMYVHPLGRGYKYQVAIDRDAVVPGLRTLTDTIHKEGGLVFFQLQHAGRQTTKNVIGRTPMAPSAAGRDPLYFVKPREMTEQEIGEVIRAFGAAARRAYEAGADGINIGGAGGYLINEFLSPFFNQRKDAWGGSERNRFRLYEEIIVAVKSAIPADMPVIVKMNAHDHTPREGITPDLAVTYASWLAKLGIDGIEIVSGTITYSNMNMWLGQVPLDEYVASLPRWKRPIGRLVMRSWVGKYDLREGWNLEAVKMIKPVMAGIPLFLVGGMRRVDHMEEVLQNGDAQFISMCRPLIREPLLVKKIEQGETAAASCISCNKCVGAVPNELPVRCYRNGLPAAAVGRGR